MKKVKFRHLTATLLIFAMSLSMLAGCGSDKEQAKDDTKENQETKQQEAPAESQESQETSQESQTAEDEGWKAISAMVEIPEIIKKDPEHLSWMDTVSPITLSVFYARRAGESEVWGETPIQQKITDLTGVTVEGTVPSTADGNELTLMIASGDPLPDIINGIDLSKTQYADLVSSDSLYDLRELIEEYCPEMWDNMDPYVRDSSLDEEGHMYYLPQQATTNSDYIVSNGWCAVRRDVCEYFEIDPSSIKTLADMEKVLELFMQNREQWPGIKYPIFFPALNSWTESPEARPFYNIFGGMLNVNEGLDMVYDKDADSVHYWLEDDYGYQALEYMWSLAQKGYVTEASFSNEGIYEDTVAGNVLFAMGTNMWFADYASSVSADVDGGRYEILPLLSKEEGQKSYMSSSAYAKGNGCGVVITKDCKDPERAIKFLEFLGSEYGDMLVHAGIYGEDWVETVDEKGLTCIKRLGKAETMEGRIERGVGNHEPDWFNTNSAYDYLSGYSYAEDFQKDIVKEEFVFDTYSAAPNTVMRSETADSEYAILRKRVEEIMKNYETQMILAKDKEEFDKLYQECLAVAGENGLDKLKEHVLGLTKEYITEMEAVGATFQ